MRLLFAACFSVTLIVLFAIHGAESGTCDNTNVCSAIKALEVKLENLVVLLSPPGKLGLTVIEICFFLPFFVTSASAEFNFFHSCSRFFL